MLGNSKKLLLIVAIVAVVLFFVFSNLKTRIEKNVTLEASADKASYSAGEEVNLSLNLTNSGTADVCLSKSAIGNIMFTSFTRDGEVLETRSAPSYFLTSFSEILKSRLIPVAPDSGIELDLTSSFDPGLGVQALSTTIPEGSSGMATFYNVEELGQYKIELVYEYVGEPSSDCADILKSPTNTATVTFTVE